MKKILILEEDGNQPIEIFYSYSHKDEDLRKELEKHLTILKRQGVIGEWHDRKIEAGQEWGNEIDKNLNVAQIILLLVSSDFIASEYCWNVEVQRAMERHEAGEARVIPVVLRPVNWQPAPFGKLQALPKEGKPVTTWQNRDEAFLDIVQGLEMAVETLSKKKVSLSSEKANQILEEGQNAKVTLQRFEFDVITVDQKGNENGRTHKSAEFLAEDLENQVFLEMVKIPEGTFRMGSPAGQGDDDERPQHYVTVPSFFMGKYPTTQAQWRAVAALPQVEIPLDPAPSNFKGDNRPVEQVSWHEAVEFCQRLSRLRGHQYRLPSEAEWEYACRAGTTTPFHFGETITTDYANCSGKQTTEVGSFHSNAFGLYDMHGNVWEWCADYWHEKYAGAPTDGSTWITGGDVKYRVLRGGSWLSNPATCCSANRNFYYPARRSSFIGFRVVCAVLPGLF